MNAQDGQPLSLYMLHKRQRKTTLDFVQVYKVTQNAKIMLALYY